MHAKILLVGQTSPILDLKKEYSAPLERDLQMAKHQIFAKAFDVAVSFAVVSGQLVATVVYGNAKALNGCTLCVGVAGRNSKTIAERILGGHASSLLGKFSAVKLADWTERVSFGDLSRKTFFEHVNFLCSKGNKFPPKASLAVFLAAVRDRAAQLEKTVDGVTPKDSDCGKAFRELEKTALVGMEVVDSLRLLDSNESLMDDKGNPICTIKTPKVSKTRKTRKVAKVDPVVDSPVVDSPEVVS
jgi:hypothetical protein